MRCTEAAHWRGAWAALLLAVCMAPAAAGETAASAQATPPRYVRLDVPASPRSATQLRLQLAQRLVAAHPDTTYLGPTPERLWAIPVLQVELNADGSVRDIVVLRHPTTGDEATGLAIAAVKRAAPYGKLTHLRRPWRVIETFLFDDDLRFKPRTLDAD